MEAAPPVFMDAREGTRRPRGRFSESKIAMCECKANGFTNEIYGQCPWWVV